MTSWNDPASSQDSSFFSADDVPQADGWSKQQLIRLENEWRRLQVSFAYHPAVRVIPLKNDPPDEYQVEYRMRTVSFDEAGQLQYVNSVLVHVWLPPAFPHEPPLVRPISALFHPNVSADGIGIGQAWTSATSTLVDVVSLVGRLLAFQAYDEDAIYNPDALEWWQGNAQILPTDTEADFSPSAGGDSLDRVCRFGPRTLEQIRAQLKQMCDSLLAPEGAPSPDDTRNFCQKMRLALNLFTEDEIPRELRDPASELDDFARELNDAVPAWEAIRLHRSTAEAALGIAQHMKDTHESLTHALQSVESMGHLEPSDAPAQVMRQLPPAPKLQLHQGNVVNLIARAGDLLNEAKSLTAKLAGLPAVEISAFASPLHRRLEAESARAAELVEKCKNRLNGGIGKLQPLRGQASVVAAALHRAADWREYADLADRGNQLVGRVQQWGVEGVQSFCIENESGRYGPMELEQQLVVGAANLAVRNPASTIVEVLNADTGAVLARGEMGTAVLAVPAEEGGKPLRTTFQLSGNAEELAVQLDYLMRESAAMLQKLASPVNGPDSWLGKAIDALGGESAQSAIRGEHDQRLGRWRILRDDLRSLALFRHRLATFRLLQRMDDVGPKLVARMSAAKRALADSTDRISMIVAMSNTDNETGQLHIPNKYAKEYPEQLRKRDQAKQEIAEVTRLMQSATAEIRMRVDRQDLRGFSDRPALAMLGELPQGWVDLEEQVSDAAIAERLGELERPLGAKLMPKDWVPAQRAEMAEGEEG